jgi:hypothetical protein
MRWGELFEEGRSRLTVGILLVEFPLALQALVVTAIMPAIAPRPRRSRVPRPGLQRILDRGACRSGHPPGANDRRGPAGPFILSSALLIIGTLLTATATSMPLARRHARRQGQRRRRLRHCSADRGHRRTARIGMRARARPALRRMNRSRTTRSVVRRAHGQHGRLALGLSVDGAALTDRDRAHASRLALARILPPGRCTHVPACGPQST